MPKVQAYTGDRIKVAVHAACLHRGSERVFFFRYLILFVDEEDELSNQPIILNCIAEEDAFNYSLAYWPRDQQIGEKLLTYLAKEQKESSEEDIEFVDLLTQLARKELLIVSTENRKLLENAVGNGQPEKLGILCLVKQDFYFSDKEKEFYENPDLFTVCFTQLSPHLYHQECMAYC